MMSRKETVGLFITGIIFATVLSFVLRLKLIDTAQAIQITISFVLVLVTAIYVKRTADIAQATRQQADASVRMAEEMREQRRPIVIPEAVSVGATDRRLITNVDMSNYSGAGFSGTWRPPDSESDIFKVHNVGNGPAIELEIVQLDKKKSPIQIEKRVILSQDDAPLRFYPFDLENQVKTTCYLVCQYCSVLSPNVRRVWYETWLPFEPIKSQSGNQIIIKPGELEFRENFEKAFLKLN